MVETSGEYESVPLASGVPPEASAYQSTTLPVGAVAVTVAVPAQHRTVPTAVGASGIIAEQLAPSQE